MLKSLKSKIIAGIVGICLAAAASAQMIYGNSFPYWDVRGPLTTQTLVTSGNTTIGGTLSVTGASTLVTPAIGAATGTSLVLTGTLRVAAPRTITGATDSPGATDTYLIANRAGTVTLTLPTVSANGGRRMCVKTIQAQTVVSAASDVVPIDTATAGTAILAGTAGKWACFVSNATAWVIMEAN